MTEEEVAKMVEKLSQLIEMEERGYLLVGSDIITAVLEHEGNFTKEDASMVDALYSRSLPNMKDYLRALRNQQHDEALKK